MALLNELFRMRQGIYEPGEKEIDVLLPNELHRNVALCVGGGAGKSTVMHRLFGKLLLADFTPVIEPQ